MAFIPGVNLTPHFLRNFYEFPENNKISVKYQLYLLDGPILLTYPDQ